MITPEMIKAAQEAGARMTECPKCGEAMTGAELMAHSAGCGK